MKFVKKPVVVEAIHYNGECYNLWLVMEGDKLIFLPDSIFETTYIQVKDGGK